MSRRALTVLLFAALALGLGLRLADTEPRHRSEKRSVALVREMVASGDWLFPHLGGVARLQKPPLYYWAAAGRPPSRCPRAGARSRRGSSQRSPARPSSPWSSRTPAARSAPTTRSRAPRRSARWASSGSRRSLGTADMLLVAFTHRGALRVRARPAARARAPRRARVPDQGHRGARRRARPDRYVARLAAPASTSRGGPRCCAGPRCRRARGSGGTPRRSRSFPTRRPACASSSSCRSAPATATWPATTTTRPSGTCRALLGVDRARGGAASARGPRRLALGLLARLTGAALRRDRARSRSSSPGRSCRRRAGTTCCRSCRCFALLVGDSALRLLRALRRA